MSDSKFFYEESRNEFENEIRDLRSIMSGEEIPIWKYMSTSGGKYSEANTRRFVDDIMNWSLAEAEQFALLYDEDGIVIGEDSQKLLEMREMVVAMKKLLYCILRVITAKGVAFHTVRDRYYQEEEIITPSGRTTMGNLLYTIKNIDDCYHLTPTFVVPEDGGYSYIRESHIVELMADFYEVCSGGKKLPLDNVLAKLKSKAVLEKEKRGIARIEEYHNPGDVWWSAWYLTGEKIKSIPKKEEYCKCFEEVVEYFEKRGFSGGELENFVADGLETFLQESVETVFGNYNKYYEVLVHIRKAIRAAKRCAEE